MLVPITIGLPVALLANIQASQGTEDFSQHSHKANEALLEAIKDHQFDFKSQLRGFEIPANSPPGTFVIVIKSVPVHTDAQSEGLFLRVTATTLMSEIAYEIQKVWGAWPLDQRLVSNGKQLEDSHDGRHLALGDVSSEKE